MFVKNNIIALENRGLEDSKNENIPLMTGSCTFWPLLAVAGHHFAK